MRLVVPIALVPIACAIPMPHPRPGPACEPSRERTAASVELAAPSIEAEPACELFPVARAAIALATPPDAPGLVDAVDADGDGSNEWHSRIWFAPFGGIARQEVDRDGDGRVDEIVVGTFTAAGLPLRWDIDRDADGLSDHSEVYYYDERGRRTTAQLDQDGDGLAEIDRRFDPPCDPPFAGCGASFDYC